MDIMTSRPEQNKDLKAELVQRQPEQLFKGPRLVEKRTKCFNLNFTRTG
ncbi:unnamed protein product [Acanthoscelides obtectus]|uniref:Uncharacterized protein n=1 Tax=Acanthoscelides obtectus TaxID=200917 RepID=A0A9P0P6A6_ACAOB|nr:unnamed protein product [Acanthoscelides obtectus]CAK1683088.1 hypothetical protein AOBTE_LOCUS34072 [Acanthoscelides obtectus]